MRWWRKAGLGGTSQITAIQSTNFSVFFFFSEVPSVVATMFITCMVTKLNNYAVFGIFWVGKMTSVSSHLQWRLQPPSNGKSCSRAKFAGVTVSHRIPLNWHIYLHLKPWKSTIHVGKQTSPMHPVGITQFSSRHSFLGGGNSNIVYFLPQKLGKLNPFWRAYFFRWVGSTTN